MCLKIKRNEFPPEHNVYRDLEKNGGEDVIVASKSGFEILSWKYRYESRNTPLRDQGMAGTTPIG